MIFRGMGADIAYGGGLRRSNLPPLLLSSHHPSTFLLFDSPVTVRCGIRYMASADGPHNTSIPQNDRAVLKIGDQLEEQ